MPIGNAHESFTQQGGIGRPVTRGHEPQRNVPALQRVERLAVDQHRAGTRVELSALRELAVHAVMKLAGFFDQSPTMSIGRLRFRLSAASK